MNESDHLHAPGWDAIDAHLANFYPGQVPHQYTSHRPYEPDSPSPLPAISVYEAPSPAHWHYISYGLSELFEKTSSNEECSGFGFELSLRVPKQNSEEQPPRWGLMLLQTLGRHILSTQELFDSGHRADLNGPIVWQGTSELTCIACIPDPKLGKIDTPFGSLLFLQLVGLHKEELEAMSTLDYKQVVYMLGEIDPWGLTDPNRESWFKNPHKAPILRRYQLGISF